MGRIRTVKPEVAKHGVLFDLEKETGLPLRFAWVMLFTQCDREGRFKWRPRELKSDILPHDEVEFARVLDALWTRGFIKKYRVENEEYGFIPTWHMHQVINNRESKSVLPEPKETFVIQLVDASSSRAHASTTPLKSAPVEGKGKEGKGREGELKPSARKARGAKSPDPAEVLPQDSKHKRIQAMIMGAWSEHNNGEQCPWSGGEASQLKELLDATPGWPDTNYSQCLDHMYRSEGFPTGTRPREFLPRLPKYFKRPLDRFKNEAGANNGNGTPNTAAARRDANNVEALVRSGMGARVQHVHADSGPAVQDRVDDPDRKSKAAVPGD